MTVEQYEFSNVFWEDPEWDDDKIPKGWHNDEELGYLNFEFLNDEETKEFFKIKMFKDPQLLNSIRLKKFKRILS